MKNPSSAAFSRGLELFEAGATQAEILAATELNEAQWVAFRWTLEMLADPKRYGGFIKGSSETALAAQIIAARDAGQSWGMIFVRCQMPESRVRRIFKEASGIDSAGLRIGKGGRYLADEPRFYMGADRPKAGTELVPNKPVLEQVPVDPEAQPERKLPMVAAAVKGIKVPKARKPLTEAQKAARAEKRAAAKAAKEDAQ
jgi:hypothetical protein